MYIQTATLLRVFPKALPLVLQSIERNSYEFYKRGVNTPLRLIHFFAQCGHETGGLTLLEEIGGSNRYNGGITFKGRGLIQLTGKANYKWIGELLGVNFVDNPKLVLKDPYFLTTALEFWYRMGLNTLADNDSTEKITRKINGGYNGLDKRKEYVRLLKQVILS